MNPDITNAALVLASVIITSSITWLTQHRVWKRTETRRWRETRLARYEEFLEVWRDYIAYVHDVADLPAKAFDDCWAAGREFVQFARPELGLSTVRLEPLITPDQPASGIAPARSERL